MKIVIAAPSAIPARRANTIQVMKMAQAFTKCNFEVVVLVPESISESKSKNVRSIEWNNLANHYGIQTEFPVHWLVTVPAFRHYDFALKVIRWAGKNGVNLVYTRMPQVAAIASSINLKTLYEVHDLPGGRIGPKLFNRFLNGKGALRLVVITRALAVDLRGRFDFPDSPPFTIIAPDGVDLDRYKELPDPVSARQQLKETRKDLKELSPSNFTAGYTGHLYDGRGINLITQAAVSLPDVNFLIVGGEPDQIQQLKNAVISRAIENIFITGFVPNAELPLFQAACEALLMPYQNKVAASSGGDISKYLSPMKLFEYMACGRVILASELPVLGEILNSKNALLLPTDRVDKWIEALISVKENPSHWKPLAENARLQSRGYTWESRAAKILENLEF